MFNMISYSRNGKIVNDLNQAYNINFSFALNKSGSLTFDMSLYDSKLTLENLEKGNIIIVYSDDIEDWYGFINDIDWNGNVVHISAVSIIQKLGQRRTTRYKIINRPAGDIFKRLLDTANSIETTGLHYDTNVYLGGTRYSMELGIDNIYDKLTDLMDMCKYKYTVSLIDISHNQWMVSFTDKVGEDLSNSVEIIYGIDTSGDTEYRESNIEFANYITAIGHTEEDDKPLETIYFDPVSISKYGLAQDSIELSDISDRATLYNAAKAEVVKRQYGRRTTTFNLNKRRGLWGTFREGDIIKLYIPKYGFGGLNVMARVMGREIDEAKELMAVAVEIVVGPDAEFAALNGSATYSTDK